LAFRPASRIKRWRALCPILDFGRNDGIIRTHTPQTLSVLSESSEEKVTAESAIVVIPHAAESRHPLAQAIAAGVSHSFIDENRKHPKHRQTRIVR
jgi:hypothetical protein